MSHQEEEDNEAYVGPPGYEQAWAQPLPQIAYANQPYYGHASSMTPPHPGYPNLMNVNYHNPPWNYGQMLPTGDQHPHGLQLQPLATQMHHGSPGSSSYHASNYSPASIGGPFTPNTSTSPLAPTLFPAGPSEPMANLYSPPSMAPAAQEALDAARRSPEHARGEPVPMDILLPLLTKRGKDAWECAICGKVHKRRDHTLTHIRSNHLDNKGFRCTICSTAFGRRGDLERHVNTTHGTSGVVQCQYCHATLQRRDNLARHLKSCRRAGSSIIYEGDELEDSSQPSHHASAYRSNRDRGARHHPTMSSQRSKSRRSKSVSQALQYDKVPVTSDFFKMDDAVFNMPQFVEEQTSLGIFDHPAFFYDVFGCPSTPQFWP